MSDGASAHEVSAPRTIQNDGASIELGVVWYAVLAFIVTLGATLSSLAALKVIPPDERLLRFDAVVLNASDRTLNTRAGPDHRTTLMVSPEGGRKRFVETRGCDDGRRTFAHEIVGKSVRISLWEGMLVELLIDGRSCIMLANSRAKRLSNRDTARSWLPWLIAVTMLSGLFPSLAGWRALRLARWARSTRGAQGHAAS